ncbi:MAG: acyl-CoA desaturase [Chitinophagaceae bacterium]|nr:acyl-CoA desaturase [Chitinophagaceae bacterium]
MSKVTFVNHPKPFKEMLDARVQEYFKNNLIDEKGNWSLYHKGIVLLAVVIIAYLALFLIQPLSWIHLVLCGVLGLAKASLGFNMMHDAAHGSYSKNKKLNDFCSFLGGDFIGGSTFLWKIKHNILHHTYTNIDGLDDDIAKYPLFRLSPNLEKKWFHKFQWLYSVPMYMFTSINWTWMSDYFVISKMKINNTDINVMKLRDHFYFWLGKLINATIFFFIPIFYFGIINTLIGYFTMHAILGLVLALVFQMAHIVEHTEFPLPDEKTNKIENEWALHQVLTTANFAMKSKLISWYVGGLNYQIEHHLYPKVAHIHYPKISKIVQDVCKECGVYYNSFPTFANALVSHFKMLKQYGKTA